jgi:hypothetical protein
MPSEHIPLIAEGGEEFPTNSGGSWLSLDSSLERRKPGDPHKYTIHDVPEPNERRCGKANQ